MDVDWKKKSSAATNVLPCTSYFLRWHIYIYIFKGNMSKIIVNKQSVILYYISSYELFYNVNSLVTRSIH